MTDQGVRPAEDLLLAVYLDEAALLDLLATIEGGFTLVERVTTGQTSGATSERIASGDVSGGSILNRFLKVSLSGKSGRTQSQATSDSREAELTHTYGSLLHRLRHYLMEERLLSPAGDNSHDFRVGNFVEFSGSFQPNPFTTFFRQLRCMLEIAQIASAVSGEQQRYPGPTGKGKAQHPQGKRAQGSQQHDLKAMTEFCTKVVTEAEREGAVTLVMRQSNGDYSAVLTLFEQYLRDRSMSELLNREFRVLGKIARHVPGGSSQKVDLLASTGMAWFPSEVMKTLASALGPISEPGFGQIDPPATTVEPPAIEIVPIAIYL